VKVQDKAVEPLLVGDVEKARVQLQAPDVIHQAVESSEPSEDFVYHRCRGFGATKVGFDAADAAAELVIAQRLAVHADNGRAFVCQESDARASDPGRGAGNCDHLPGE
jgi:hypothetical protein